MGPRQFVYRVQDRFGVGPWRPGVAKHWAEGRDGDEAKALSSIAESPEARAAIAKHPLGTWSMGSGCLSHDDLRRWFNLREYRALLRLGYRAVALKEFRVIWRGEVQVVFVRRRHLTVDAVPFALYPDCDPGVAVQDNAARAFGERL